MDIFSVKKRSEVMSKIRGEDTKLEIKVRSYLFRLGFRFKKNVKNLPGKPDIVLKKYNSVIFINGCFWHGHKSCKLFKMPKTRTQFWREKINANIDRDVRYKRKLRHLGWNVVILWECRLEKNFEKQMSKTLSKFKDHEDG